ARVGEGARVAVFEERGGAGWDDDLPMRPAVQEDSTGHELFAGRRDGSRIGIVLALGVLVVLGAVGVVVALDRGLPFGGSATPAAEPTTSAAAPSAPAQAAAPASVPVELIALGHERDGDRLTVRGIVRNPSTSAAIDQLAA